MRRFLLPLLWLATLAPLSAQELILREAYSSTTSLELNSLFGILPQHGHAPIRATIRNGSTTDRTWTFSFRATANANFNDNGRAVTSTFRATVPAGAAAEFDFTVPLPGSLRHHGYTQSMQLDCTIHATGLPSTSGSMASTGPSDEPQILIGQQLHLVNGSALDNEASSATSRSYGNASFAGTFQPKLLPSDWRAYVGYDAMMLTADEWLEIAPGARHAILAWNRFGGRIFIYTNDSDLDLAALRFDGDGAGERKARRSLGRVEIREIEASLALDAKSTVSEMFSLPASSEALRADHESGWELQQLLGEKSFHHELFVAVLLLFGILVGPINLFVFAKSGQRHRMFFTTPLISLGASGVLVVIIILQDGFGGRGARFVHLEVRPDAGENAAYIQQEQIARTGVLLSSGHTLPEAGLVTSVPLAASPWARLTNHPNQVRGHYELQSENGKLRASGDWYQSRSEQGHVLAGIRPTRGRVEIEPGSQPPRLVSSFDFPVELLVFRDEAGTCWRAENIRQGHPVVCEKIDRPSYDGIVEKHTSLASASRRKAIRGLSERTGHFFAVAPAAPPLESFDAIDWQENHAVVTGPVVEP